MQSHPLPTIALIIGLLNLQSAFAEPPTDNGGVEWIELNPPEEHKVFEEIDSAIESANPLPSLDDMMKKGIYSAGEVKGIEALKKAQESAIFLKSKYDKKLEKIMLRNTLDLTDKQTVEAARRASQAAQDRIEKAQKKLNDYRTLGIIRIEAQRIANPQKEAKRIFDGINKKNELEIADQGSSAKNSPKTDSTESAQDPANLLDGEKK